MNKQQLLHMLEEAALAYQDIQPCFFDTNTTVIDDCDTGVQYGRKNLCLPLLFGVQTPILTAKTIYPFGQK